MKELLIKLFSKVAMVACLATAFTVAAFADSVTFTYSDYQGYGTQSSGSSYTMTKTDVSIANNKFYGNTSYAHFYASATTTVTPASGVTITNIVLTASATNYNGYQSGGTITSSTGSVSGNNTTVTWTGSATESFTISNSKQIRWTSIVVTYTKSGGDPSTYTVSYNANGGTGELSDPNSPYASGASVTVLSNSFTRDGYTFTNWNTAADGNGTDYAPGATFSISANTTLYAQWSASSSADLVYDFSSTDNFVTSYPGSTHPNTGNENNLGTFYYTNGNEFTASGTSRYFNDSGYFLLGKTNATLQLPTFSFDVEKIVITGKAGASGSVNQNIYVGDNAVSTQTTGATGANTYLIADGYESAGTVYTLKVTSNHNTQITKIEVYAKDANAPSFSISNNNELAYNATSGSFDFTVNNPANGETTVSESVDWISNATVSGSSITFNTTENEGAASRNGNITLTYTYDNDKTVIKNVTVVQAGAPYTTIPALFSAATDSATEVNVSFNNWVVSGVSTNGKQVFVTDGSNGFSIYDNNGGLNATYAAGKILSGTVPCSLKLQTGFAQLTGVSGLTVTSGGVISEANIELSALSGVNTGAVVSYDDLTCSVSDGKYYLSDGNTTIQVYNALYAFNALENGKHYNITGVYQQFNSTKEILPRSAADIEEVVVNTPSIYIGSTSLTGFSYKAGNGPSTSKSFTVSGEHLTENITLSLTSAAFEMSTTSNGVYSASITLTPTAGDVSSTSIYVRLKANVSIGSYNEAINLYSAGAENKAVSLSGSVTAPDGPHWTWDLTTDQTASASEDELTWTSTYASMSIEKATSTTNANNYYPGKAGQTPPYTSTRFYKNSELTITPESGYIISSIVFEATTSNYAGVLYNSVFTNATATHDENETIVTITPTDGTAEISATIGGTCGFSEVNVYYLQVPISVTVTASLSEDRYWATFYNGSACYELPQGAKAYTLNSSKHLYLLGDGTVIPANTAVIIIADASGVADTIDLTLTKVTNTIVAVSGGGNVLEGKDFDYPKSAYSGTPYVLGIPDTLPLGFYKFTGTYIPAGKAYYIVNE